MISYVPSVAEMEALHEAMLDIGRSSSVADASEALLDNITNHESFDSAAFHVYDNKTATLRLHTTRNMPDDCIRYLGELNAHDGYVKALLQHNQPIYTRFHDFVQRLDFEVTEDHDISAFGMVPVTHDQRFLASLSVGSRDEAAFPTNAQWYVERLARDSKTIFERINRESYLTRNTPSYYDHAQKEKLMYRLTMESMLSDICERFDEGLFGTNIDAILELLGRTLDVDRTYLFLFRDNMRKIDNTNEWCKEGVEPQIQNLQDVDSDIIPWWMEKLHNNEVINYAYVDQIPLEGIAEKEILESQDILSVLVVPIHCDEKLRGFIGFDQTSYHREWEKEDISIIEVVARMLGNHFLKKELTDALLLQNEQLRNKNIELEEFTSSLFHDIQSPLVTIYSYADYIKKYSERYEDEELEFMMDTIKRNALVISQTARKMGGMIRVGHKT